MKKLLMFSMLLILPLLSSACAVPSKETPPVLAPEEAGLELNEPPAQPVGKVVDNLLPVRPVAAFTAEEAQIVAAAYYPDEVRLQYDELALISGYIYGAHEQQAWCYLFTVYNGAERRVSRAAVEIEEGGLWFIDMYTVDEAEPLWMREDFMGGVYPGPEQLPEKREPYLEHQQYEGSHSLYMAYLDSIPEFTDANEGGVSWFPDEQRLLLTVTKVTGSVSGAADGPQLRLEVVWEDGQPRITDKEFSPAPVYSHPRQVLKSNEELFIADERLLEIAEYARSLIMEYADNAEGQ